jgi:hypothetical protein
MINSGNNDREQNCLLLSPRVKRAQSDWQATVILGCPRWGLGSWAEYPNQAIPNLASSFLIILHCFSLKAGAGESVLRDCPISYIFETSHPNRGGIPRDTAS